MTPLLFMPEESPFRPNAQRSLSGPITMDCGSVQEGQRRNQVSLDFSVTLRAAHEEAVSIGHIAKIITAIMLNEQLL
jgi:hypothetical protein